MRNQSIRAFAEFLGWSFRADRGGAWATLVMFTLRPLATVAFALSLAWMLASLVDRDLTAAIAAACVACVMLVAQVASSKVSLSISARMVERTGRTIDRDLQTLLHGTRTLEHFHTPEVLNKLEVIRAERARLTEGADVTGLILGTLLRLSITVVVAVLASPWLLLVPAAAAASYTCQMRAERARHRGRTAAAEAARLRQEYLALGTDPDHRDEFLLSSGRALTLNRHERWGRAEERARARGMWTGFLWSLLGVAITTAAFGIGIYSLTLMLLTGSTSVATGLAALLLLSGVTVLMSALIRFFSALSDSLRTTGLLLEVRGALDNADSDGSGGPEGSGGRDGGVEGPRREIPSGVGIELRDVSYTYPASDGAALEGVDLRLEKGRVYALVGENGSGKTTLVHLLAGLLRPTAGAVEHADGSRGRAETSVVAQDFARFEFPLEDGIRLGNTRPGDAELKRALTDAGFDEPLNQGRLSLSTRLGRSFADGTELSKGQWQRVAVCRGLLPADTELLLLDEPTSAIDPLAEDALLSSFTARARELVEANGGVAIIVTHRMSLVREVDDVILLEKGRIVDAAPHETLLANEKYRRLYEAQQHAYTENPLVRTSREGT